MRALSEIVPIPFLGISSFWGGVFGGVLAGCQCYPVWEHLISEFVELILQ